MERAAAHAGLELGGGQRTKLELFGDWLRDEGVAAGAIGPNEAARIEQRHLADSLLFALPWRLQAPTALLDVGSGAGLPGIPLAVAWPECRVTLLDRSTRRCQLARRAQRVLELTNVEIRHGDLGEIETKSWPAATARAVGRQLWGELGRILAPGGLAVVGGSHTAPPNAGPGVEVVAVPDGVLDHTVWLLMIRSS